MRKTATALATLAAVIATPAFAADMPLKAPPPPPPAAFSWTGCYIGPNIGGKWADTSGETDVGPAPATTGPGGTAPATAPGAFAFGHATDGSFMGGGQIGCNYQQNQWVFGVEGDVDAQSWSVSRAVTPATATFPFIPGDNFSATSHWQASFRGRIGYAWDRWMLYATGGLGLTEVRANTDFIPVGIFPATVVSDSKTLAGATLGGGLEYAFTNNVSIGVEGRYTWYGSETFNAGLLSTSASTTAGVTTFAFAPATQRINLNTAEVMAKLDWHFNLGGPLATRY
jgi:outer membrane immunogenic protein